LQYEPERGLPGQRLCGGLFKTLKRELETLDGKRSAAEVRQSVFIYIEAYYNLVRLYSALDYAAPDVFHCGQDA
jgi:transposase InsO family protein